MSTASRFNSGVAILSIQPVQSLDLPELKIYLTLRRVVEHERQGVLVAANIKTIRRLLASRFTVLSVLLTPAWLEKLEPQLRDREEDQRKRHGYRHEEGEKRMGMGAHVIKEKFIE